MQVVKTALMELVIRDDGIIRGREVDPEVEPTAQQIADDFDTLARLVAGRPRPGLWDVRAMHNPNPAAWKALIERLSESVTALAILADARSAALLGSFPDTIDALILPVRVFHDENEAIQWLHQFVKDR